MLVLTRKVDEAIRVGKDIEIVILDIEKDRIKIGIEAPSETRIVRSELIRETKVVNIEATRVGLFSLPDSEKKDEKLSCADSDFPRKQDNIPAR